MRITQSQLDALAQETRRKKRAEWARRIAAGDPSAKADEETGVVTFVDERGYMSTAEFSDQGLVGVRTAMGRHIALDRDASGRVTAIDVENQVRYDIAYEQGALTEVRRDRASLLKLGYQPETGGVVAQYPDGVEERLKFDSTGELLLTATDGLGGETQLIRDPAGHVTELRDPGGHTTTFEVAEDGTPLATAFPDGSYERYEPTEVGWDIVVNEMPHASVAVNDEGDFESIRFADGHALQFKFAQGLPQEALNDQHRVKLAYDGERRLLAEELDGRSVAFTYDASGNLEELKGPNGAYRYQYDRDDLLSAVTTWNGSQIRLSYATSGQISRIEFPNGVTTHVDASSSGQVRAITTSRAGAILLRDRYESDVRDRVVRRIRHDRKQEFEYDAAGRLIGVTTTDGVGASTPRQECYAYDAAGNRTATNGRAATFDAMNRMLTDGSISFRHDVAGNLISRAGSTPATYRYNGQGLLIEVLDSKGGPIRFTYDGFGRRVTKQAGARTTRYAWSGRQLLSEEVLQNGTSIERRDYVYYPGEHLPLAVRVNGKPYYYHTDRAGTVLAMTDARGAVVWQAEYSPFGEAKVTVESIAQPLRFAGHYYDAETRLHYNLFRYYDPALGRYITPDPIRYEKGRTNFYQYADNDPINRCDPEGHFVIPAALLIIAGAALVGGLIGGAISAAQGGSFWKGAAAGAVAGAIGAAAPILGAAAGLGGAALLAVGLAGDAIAGGVEACMDGEASLATFAKGAGIALVTTVGTLGLAKIPGVKKLLSAVGRKVAGAAAGLAKRIADKLAKKLAKKAPKLLAKLGKIGHAISKLVCKVTGHPVDIATGRLFTDRIDFELTGPLPLVWERTWYSTSDYDGPLGHGWHHNYDLGLIADDDAVAVRLQDGRGLVFPALPIDGESFDEVEGLTLRRDASGYVLTNREGWAYRFAPCGRDEEHSLVALASDGDRLQFQYDGAGHLQRISDTAGREVSLLRNERNLIREIRLRDAHSPDQPKPLVRYEYSEQGDLISAFDAAGQPFRYQYENHLLNKETDRNGYSFFFKFDGSDSKARCVATWGQDGLYTVKLVYQPNRTFVEYGDRGLWKYTHNGAGMVTAMTDPYGGVTKYRLDARGRVVEETDPKGNVTRLEYDASGAHTRRVSAIGYVTPPEQLDPDPPDPNSYELPDTPLEWEQGGIASPAAGGGPDASIAAQLPPVVRAGLNRIRAQATVSGVPVDTLDARGRIVERTYADGTQETWSYDAEDNVLAYRDRDGTTVRSKYGSWNALQGEADALGNVTSYQYSQSEQLTRLVDPGGTEHRFNYDLKDRNTEIWINGALLDRYVYDAADNLVESRDGQGNWLVRYEIGPGNFDAQRVLADGDVHTFSYDAQGRLVLATTPSLATEFTYDSSGAQIRDLRDGKGVEHTLDSGGEVSETTYLDHYSVSYTSDPDQEDVRVVTDPTGASHRFSIGVDGEVLKQLASGTSELACYDDTGRCIGKQSWRPGSRGSPWQRLYAYSVEGDLCTVEDSRAGTTRYEYDSAHRLRADRRPNRQAFDFRFDAAGNLLQQAGLTGVRVGGANLLAQANGDTFEYNLRGHVAVRRGASGDTRYHYNALDLLTRIEINDEAWEAKYDPLCRRVSKTWRGQTTVYWWDDFRLAGELRHDGSLRLYVYPDHKSLVPFMFVEYASMNADPAEGQRYFIFTNHLGVPLRVEDSNGNMVWTAEIDPFGSAHVTVDSGIDMPLRWPGHYSDAETGLNYNRFRYYSPELGRYLQVDPLGTEGSVNLYAAPNNPLASVDLDGQKTCGRSTTRGSAKRRTGPKQKRPINYKLRGKVHPKTGVPFSRRGYPIFKAKGEARLPKNLYKASDSKQFTHCNKQLYDRIQNDPSLRKQFTERQIRKLSKGKTPKNMTWHHHESGGRMQLVDRKTHNKTGHSGGRNIWGGGTEAR